MLIAAAPHDLNRDNMYSLNGALKFLPSLKIIYWSGWSSFPLDSVNFKVHEMQLTCTEI